MEAITSDRRSMIEHARPRGLPVLHQVWRDNLFVHYPVEARSISRLLPSGLELDTYAGQAWIGIIPFTLANVRPAFTPPLPFLGRSHEVNLRTYVTYRGQPGVWFFSLDSTSWAAIAAGRFAFHLPYLPASVRMRKHDGIIEVTSRRRRGFGLRAELELTCSPVTELGESVPGSLEYFLVERYSMYVVTQDGIRRGPIHHDPWRLEGVDVGLIETNLLESIGVVPSGPALVHYAARQKTWFWPLREP